MKKLVVRFLNDHGGGTAIRPHRGGISIAIIAVVNTIGTNLNTTFSDGHLVSLATRMADLLAVAPYSAKAF